MVGDEALRGGRRLCRLNLVGDFAVLLAPDWETLTFPLDGAPMESTYTFGLLLIGLCYPLAAVAGVGFPSFGFSW